MALLGIYHQGVLQVSKNVLLYLSLLLCSQHGYCCRLDVIPRAEWRLEVRLSTSLFRNWKSHGIKMYNFCCGLQEYLDNRESVVFFKKNIRFFVYVFHSCIHTYAPGFPYNNLFWWCKVNYLQTSVLFLSKD